MDEDTPYVKKSELYLTLVALVSVFLLVFLGLAWIIVANDSSNDLERERSVRQSDYNVCLRLNNNVDDFNIQQDEIINILDAQITNTKSLVQENPGEIEENERRKAAISKFEGVIDRLDKSDRLNCDALYPPIR